MNKKIAEEIAEQTSEFLMNLVDDLIGHDGHCKVKVHAIRHSGDMMRFRVEVQEVSVREDGVEMTPEAKDFAELAACKQMSKLGQAGITPEHLGRVFTINGGIEHRVTGWNRHARKRPVLTKRLDSGQEYAWTVPAIAKYLGVNDV